MRSRLTDPLRAVPALVGVALLVAALVAGATALAARGEARQAHADAWERAAAATLAVEGWLRRHLQPLAALATSAQAMTAAGAVDPRWSATLDPFATGLLAANARLTGLAVMTPDGRVRRYRRDGPPVTERWSDRPPLNAMVAIVLDNARAGHTAPVWGQPVRRAGSGHALFNVRVPLLDADGEPRAVLMAMIDLEPLVRALPDHLRRAELTPYMLHGRSSVLAHPTLDARPPRDGVAAEGGRPLPALDSVDDPALAALERAGPWPARVPFDPAPARVRGLDTAGGPVVHVQRVVVGFSPDPVLIGVHMPAPDQRRSVGLVPWVAAASAGGLTALMLGGLLFTRAGRRGGAGDGGAGDGGAAETALTARPVEETEATVLRVALADAGRLAEVLPPARALAAVRAFTGAVTGLIGRHGGRVTESHGPIMVAVFNLPDPLSGHAQAALNAALGIQTHLEAGPLEGQVLRARQGVATGTVLAGALGPPGDPRYGVLGPAVDLAGELEAMTARTGTRILVSDRTAALAPSVGLRSLGKLPVPGQGVAARVHTPVSSPGE